MIKKCKITNIFNGVLYGVTKEPIKNGAIRDLNSGQIMTCMLNGSVDEILSDGTLVRLNKDNYKLNNESKKIFLQDELKIDENINSQDQQTETPDGEKKEETPVDPEPADVVPDEKKEETPVDPEATNVVPADENKEEVPVDEKKNETPVNNNYQKNNKKRNK